MLIQEADAANRGLENYPKTTGAPDPRAAVR